ncbi:hypothetical protein GBF38_000061, partial [Nibea albiflora]
LLFRLDRLFILLDTGTTPVTRKAAAQQLGEVVKLHPHELNNLLSKVLTYLRSPNWDTRIAAGQAVEAIVKNIPEWDPSPKPKEGEMDPKERLARQRKLLQKKLGLDMGAAIGMDTEELFNDEDLDYTCQTSGLRAHGSKTTAGSSSRNHIPIQAAELIDSEFRPGMSSRQKNKAKRMAKLVAKQRSRDMDPNEKSVTSFIASVVFIVVAPVRETCAQTLGVALRHMNETGVSMTVDVLLKLLKEDQWEVRHGGLLGIKYALAVRQDLISVLLPRVLPAITIGLQDLDDDVRAVAASSLIPVVEGLVQLLPNKVPFIVNTLWDSLLDLDDLTASTNSIMTLLSSLLTYPQVRESSMQQSLTVLVPSGLAVLETHNIVKAVRCGSTQSYRICSGTSSQSCILESNEEILELIQKVWMELLSQAPQQYVVAASCPWMGAWLCLMMQASHIPIDLNMLLEVKARCKVVHLIHS